METKESPKGNTAHVLFLPYPTQGHINPLLQFAKRLASRGLRATLVTTVFITKTIKIDAGPIGIESISDGFDEAGYAEAESAEAYLTRMEAVGSRTLTELVGKLAGSGHPVSCIVYDSFLPWALDVGKRLGLIGASFFTQMCTVNAIYYHVYHGSLKVPMDAASVSSMPAVPPLETVDLPSFFSAVGSYPAYLRLLLNQYQNLESANWVICNTFDKLEEEIVEWMQKKCNMITVGPTVPSMFLDQRLQGDTKYSINLYELGSSDAAKEWLDTKPVASVVYVAFGSLTVMSVEHMEELAQGLIGCKKHVLWVVRETEMEKLPAKFTEVMGERGLVLSWSNQIEVLAHRAVGCFATHAGWNSTMEALCAGVPMVCLPQWTDQPTNAKFVEDVWGVGARAREDEAGIVRVKEMERCIREVMDGERSEEIKKNARKWKELAVEAMAAGGSSDINIEKFASSLLKS